jgi:hypothetical protein
VLREDGRLSLVGLKEKRGKAKCKCSKKSVGRGGLSQGMLPPPIRVMHLVSLDAASNFSEESGHVK